MVGVAVIQTSLDFEGHALVPAVPQRTPQTEIAEVVIKAFCQRCLEVKESGAKAVAEDLRRYSTLPYTEKYKINNSQVSQLARIAEQRHPELRGLFEHRKRKERAEDAADHEGCGL